MKLLQLILLTLFSLLFVACKEEEKTEVIKLTLGHDMPLDTPIHLGANRFSEIVSYKTKGRIDIQIIPNQEFGNDYVMINSVIADKLDFTIAPTAKLASYFKEYSYIDLPFLFRDKVQSRNLIMGEINEHFYQESISKFSHLAFFESGLKQLTSNKEIKSLEDLKGLNLRVMDSENLKDVYKEFGMKLFSKDFHEIKNALLANEFDSQENPITSIFGMGIHKAQKYLYITNHSYLAQAFIANKNLSKKISPEDLKIIQDAAIEAMKYQIRLVDEFEQDNLDKMINDNILISQFPNSLTKDIEENIYPILKKKVNENHFFKNLLEDQHNNIFLGANISITGPGKNAGISIKRGIELALEEINANDGIHGKNLYLKVLDNQGNVDLGVQNYKDLLEDKQVIATMSGLYSPILLKIKEHYKEAKNNKPLLVPWSAATNIVNIHDPQEYVFRYSVRDEYAAQLFIDRALKKTDRICALFDNSKWGESNLDGIVKILKKKKIKPTMISRFDWGQTDFKETLRATQEVHCGVIIFVGNSPEGIYFLKDLEKLDITTPVLSHWGVLSGEFLNKTEEILKKRDFRFLNTFTFNNTTNKEVKNLERKYREKYSYRDKRIFSEVGTIHAYELTKILAIALKKTKNLTPEEIKRALKEVSVYKGLFMEHKNIFKDSNEALKIENITFCRLDKNGLKNCEK